MNKTQLKQKYGEEEVLVIPHDAISNIADGFNLEKRYNQYDSMGYFIKRYDAEGQPAFQQLIPYSIISNNDGSKFFVAKRIDGDHRLAGKLSLGFGGHINPVDISLEESIIRSGLLRELDEEVEISFDEIKFLGTIRDMKSSTNDHFGLAFIVHSKDEVATKIKETDKLVGEWMTKKELYDNYFKFEGWSKILIDYLCNVNN